MSAPSEKNYNENFQIIDNKPNSKNYKEQEIEISPIKNNCIYVIQYVKNGEFKQIVEQHVPEVYKFAIEFNNLKLQDYDNYEMMLKDIGKNDNDKKFILIVSGKELGVIN